MDDNNDILSNDTDIDPAVIALVEVDIVRNWNILPYKFDAETGTLSLYTSNNKNIIQGSVIYDLLHERNDRIRKIDFALAQIDVLNLAINKFYKTNPVVKAVTTGDDIDNTKISQIVRNIFNKARELKASDIHITPILTGANVQYRVDGNLIMADTQINLEDRNRVINFIKTQAKIETSITNKNQGGVIDKGDIEYRVGTYPNGRDMCESIVLRLQDKNVKFITLDEMGFVKEDLDTLREICQLPDGITMLVGPTGQGKSTTMNGLIREFNPNDYAIFSIEDPVEQRIEGASQANVIGGVNTNEIFAMEDGVEAILRLDPDIAYIGEIRSAKTAHAVAQLAQTGHLVFTTLHAKDCAESIVRMKGLGINIADFLRSLNCIGAQRLVGLNCPHCREKIESPYNKRLTDRERSYLIDGKYSYASVGCEKCHNTGVLGRKPLLELLVLDNKMRDFFAEGPGLVATIDYLNSIGFKSMWDKGLLLLAEGEISLENLWKTVRSIKN